MNKLGNGCIVTNEIDACNR